MTKPSSTYKSIGEALRRLRKEEGLTLEELAERAGISVSFLSHIERGSRQAPLSTLDVLARILRTDLQGLMAPASVTIAKEKPSTYDAKIKNLLGKLSEKEKKGLHALLKQFNKSKD